jgi:hypothetical protein
MDQVPGFLEKRGAILQMQVGALLKLAVGYKELGKRLSSSEFCVMHVSSCQDQTIEEIVQYMKAVNMTLLP